VPMTDPMTCTLCDPPSNAEYERLAAFPYAEEPKATFAAIAADLVVAISKFVAAYFNPNAATLVPAVVVGERRNTCS